MENNRRDFVKKSVSLAALSVAGLNASSAHPLPHASRREEPGFIKDAGMQLCLAYFWGIEPHKVALAKQMNVLEAVCGINPDMVGMQGDNWEYEVIRAVQDAWKQEGLTLRVIEGPPSLYTKTKLGLDGRDEEIDTFITFLENISRLGINTICYNWMPVISWARTTVDRPSRGGALVSAFDREAIAKEAPITEYGELTPDRMWCRKRKSTALSWRCTPTILLLTTFVAFPAS